MPSRRTLPNVIETSLPSSPFPYHRQDTEDSCGAACEQMILDYRGPGHSSNQLTDQLDLITEGAISWNDNWTVSPAEMEKWLDGRNFAEYQALGWASSPRPPLEVRDFHRFAEACRKATSNLYNGFFYPPIITIDNNQHWVILTACGSQDGAIIYFCYNDPYPPLQAPPNTPLPGHGLHHTSSDVCAEYRENGHLSLRGLCAKTRFLKILVYNREGENSTPITPTPPASEPLLVDEGSLSCPEISPFALSPVIEDVASKALCDLDGYRLTSRKTWSEALSRTTAGVPLRIKPDSRRPGLDFHLVPIQNSRGQTKSLVQIDAGDGAYWGSLRLPPITFLFREDPGLSILVEEVKAKIKKMLGQKKGVDSGLWDIELIKQMESTRPELIWIPCREAISSFFPFYVIQPKPELPPIYVRIDGKVFPKLYLGNLKPRRRK
jgi:hypothetical protein